MSTAKNYIRQIGKFLQNKTWMAVCFLILCVLDLLDRNLTMLSIHGALSYLLLSQKSAER